MVQPVKSKWLPWFLRGVILLAFLVIFARLSELQLIKGQEYRNLSDSNRIRRVPIAAPRGVIYARGGEVLVGNEKIERKIVFDPQGGFRKLDIKDFNDTSETIIEYKRKYELGSLFAHVSGYLGLANPYEMDKVNPDCPEKGTRKNYSYVGRSGLEEKYECDLAGIDGEEMIEVDTMGRKIRVLGRKEPIPGKDIKTAIDFNLQKKSAEIMETQSGKKGALVISDTQGQILALYSLPSFDPNAFTDESRKSEVQSLLVNKNLPLFNRVISGAYHPGSVFKPVVALAGLEEKKIDENYLYEDKGVININEYSYSNWYFTQYGKIEGRLNIKKALARSTDTFFYNLGELLGISKIANWAKIFGYGKTTGIDLPGETAGLVPTPEWKEKTKDEKWFLGNTYHVSIGQGDLLASPLQINSSIAAITEGQYCRPVVLGGISCRKLSVDMKNIEIVKDGMKQVCSTGGTGFTFFDFKFPTGETDNVGCKTGTAETGSLDETHAWFTAFAPTKNPEIVATILVERSGEGSKVAGPLMRKVFDYWYGRNGN